jgi:hypothetical protein
MHGKVRCCLKNTRTVKVRPFRHPSLSRSAPTFVNATNACNFFVAFRAEDAFLTGTFGAQTPVGSIDGKAIGDGSRPMLAWIQALYRQLINDHVAQTHAR